MSVKGVPSSVLVGEDHIQVRAALVALLGGGNEAIVWTRIEYRSRHVAFAHENAGEQWWEVTRAELGREVGLKPAQIDTAIANLISKGFLVAEQHSLPMQTYSYSPVIIQSGDSRIGQVPIGGFPDSNPEIAGLQSGDSGIAPSIEEREDDKTLSSVKPPSMGETFAQPLCDVLSAELTRNQVKHTVSKKWLADARLMVDADGRDPHEAKALIEWACRDSFWRSNILSMPKFREKYDQLRLKRAEQGGKPGVMDHGRNVHDILAQRRAGQKGIAS